MADFITVVAAALTAAWKRSSALRPASRFLPTPRGRFRDACGEGGPACPGKPVASKGEPQRLLGNPTFAAFAADPDDPLAGGTATGRLDAS